MSAHPATHPDKDFATLQAKAALAGATLQRTEDDRGDPLFCISKWGLTRQFSSLPKVAEWLERLGGKS